jgi:lysylphosphatidylglycerol synthetase-like protein (DUF2156 family)
MKNIVASMAVLTSLSQFLCIFCCVLPTATGILALLSVFGVAGSNSFILGDLSTALHPYRGIIMTVSICLISLSWFMYFYAKKQEKASCGCTSKHKRRPIFLMVATLLLVVNLGSIPFIH